VRLAEPVDQASGLRRLFTPAAPFRALAVLGADAAAATRACVALARGLGKRGERVMLVDEVPPPRHAGGILGVLARHGLSEVRQRGLLDIVQPAGEGVVLLSAVDGLSALRALSETALRRLADDWRAREETPEWLLLNSGPALPESGLAVTADERVLVLTASRARLAEAYALMKAAQAFRPARAWRVLVEDGEAARARALFDSLAETARRFIGIVPEYLGHLPRERAASPAETGLMERLVERPDVGVEAGRVDFEQYWQRMWLHSRLLAESGSRESVSEGPRNARRSSG